MSESENFWDSYASSFDAIYGTDNTIFNTLVNKLFRQAMRLRFEKTIHSIPDDNVSVIDIGCGPGHYCFELAKSGKREVIGIDFSEEMLSIAKSHAGNFGMKNLNFKAADILDFSPEGKFDYSIMMGFIEYFHNPAEIIAKAAKITSKKIFISFPVSGGILGWQRQIRYRNRCYLHMYSKREIIELLERTGISDYTIDRISRDFFVTISLS